jgi:N6-adenosine-specific RNA methylase IME4
MLAAEILPVLEAEAAQRQRAALKRGEEAPVGPILDQRGRAREHVSSTVGVSTGYVAAAKHILQADPELATAVRSGAMTIPQANRALVDRDKAARREENRRLVDAAPSADRLIGTARFATIVIDPPWDWQDEGYKSAFGRKQPPYATMSLEKIRALPVPDLADEDAHLYLWATSRILRHAFPILDHWGFRFASLLTWCKPTIGLGSYFRNSTEPVLVGVRGSQPLLRHDVGTWFEAPRGPKGHSSKPDRFYEIVESCSPGPILEMFGRRGRDGWSVWGAEAPVAAASGVGRP